MKEENGITILGPTPIQRRGARAPSSTGSSSSSLSVDGGIIGGGGIMERFDSLKREATKLERNLEEKVSRYQQLVQSISDPTSNASNDLFMAESGLGATTATSTSSSVEEEATLRHDIQRTLTTLQDLVSTQLQPAAEALGNSSSLLLVKRYREILFDLKGDYEKSRQSHTRKLERRKLLAGSAAASQTTNSLEIDQTGMDHLMRERQHLHNSSNAATAVIQQAAEIRNDLRAQGSSLGRAQSMMGQIVNNIPGINTVIENIRRKKSKDEMIVIGVIASCILFTVWYLFG